MRLPACFAPVVFALLSQSPQPPAAPAQSAPAPVLAPAPYSEARSLAEPKAGLVRVIVVRHAESVGNASKDDQRLTEEEKDRLTKKGEEQAAAVGAALKPLHPSELLHSPAKRAEQTAALAAAALDPSKKMMIMKSDAFGPIRFGNPTHADKPALRELVDAWNDGRDPRLEGGENLEDLATRVKAALVQLVTERKKPSGPITIFTHSEVLTAVLCEFDPQRMARVMTKSSVINGSFGVFDVTPGQDLRMEKKGLFAPIEKRKDGAK